MTKHYINRYLLRILGILCLMLSLGIKQSSYAQDTEQEQLAKIRTFKKEYIATVLLPSWGDIDLSAEHLDGVMEAYFSAVNNPSRNEYEAAHVTIAIKTMKGVMNFLSSNEELELCMSTFKKALRSPAAYNPNPYDMTTQESEFLGADHAMILLGVYLLDYLDSGIDISNGERLYGIVKWGINIPKFINDFEQRYGASISKQEFDKQYAYASGVFAHDLIKYLQARGIAISPQDLREAYRKLRPLVDNPIAWEHYSASIEPKIGDDEAYRCIRRLKGFVQQTKQNYQRNVATPLGIKLPE